MGRNPALSYSSVHSLLFAIEPFLDSSSPESKVNAAPCVWVLEPAALNRKIFQHIKEHLFEREIQCLFDELKFSRFEKRALKANLKRYSV